MGLLSGLAGSPFDPLVDKATSEENTAEDWALIMDIVDRVTVDSTGAKECLRSILRRLNSPIPVVLMQCLTLTDALVSNCGKKFHLEVCSRDFETALRNIIASKAQPKVSERARLLVKKWAKEFRHDPQLALMPALYERLKKEGVSFASSEPKRRAPGAIDPAVLKNPDAVSSAQEEADILKAIELRPKEAGGGGSGGGGHHGRNTNASTLNTTTTASAPSAHGAGGGNSGSLYPTFSLTDNVSKVSASSGPAQPAPSKEPIKVRALYDFEAAEDNELTFKAGEIILVSDSSDANWWKGSNHRGEGLFPANFVSTDLNAEPEPVYKSEKRVQFNEEIKVKVLESNGENNSPSSEGTVSASPVEAAPVEIDESRIDRLLHLLHEADPQSENCDTEELLQLEEQCVAMMPLIDQQIELIDKRHATLTTLNGQLNSALNLYHDLMKESFQMDQAAAAAAAQAAAQAAAYAANMAAAVQQQPAMVGGGGGGGGGYPGAYAPVPGMGAGVDQPPPPPYHPSMQVPQQQYGAVSGAPVAGYYGQQQQPQPTQPMPNVAAYQQQQPMPNGPFCATASPSAAPQPQMMMMPATAQMAHQITPTSGGGVMMQQQGQMMSPPPAVAVVSQAVPNLL
ncbi:Signal transducing adapter molecule 2 [Tyrophagus putrescentiae]|nr:Signal transducing adapter molecule 2 [Tyrophagus putrescentiae]